MKAYIHDCDPFGIVYYSRYLEWAEESRIDTYTHEWETVKSQGKTFIPARVQVDYKRPIMMLDEFEMFTIVSKMTGVIFELHTSFIVDNHEVCSVVVTMVCVDTATHKPARHNLK